MAGKTLQELADEYARLSYEVALESWGDKDEAERFSNVVRESYMAGYHSAYENIYQHIQFLESQLRQANNTIMRLEAER